MPLISIGLPVYNGENYLEESLQSILCQTYTNFELIISDNCSTDETGSICQRYAMNDPRIRYYRVDMNRGAAWNYNRVFELATGEYFKWAAHDDLIAKTYLECCIQAIESCPDVILCYPKTLLIDENGGNPTPYDDGLNLNSPLPVERFKHFLFRGPRRCNPVFGLIRREYLAMTGLIGAYNASDEVLLAHLSLLGQFREIPEELMFRRIHPNASILANRTLRELLAWFDPASRTRICLPTLKHFIENNRCIFSMQMSITEKGQCIYLALKKFWWDSHLLKNEILQLLGIGLNKSDKIY